MNVRSYFYSSLNTRLSVLHNYIHHIKGMELMKVMVPKG